MLYPGGFLFGVTALLLLLVAVTRRRPPLAASAEAAGSNAAAAASEIEPAAGTTVADDALWGRTRGGTRLRPAGGASGSRTPLPSPTQHRQVATLVMSMLVSALSLGAAFYLILSQQFGTEAEKWAFGTVGTILGYWLNSSR